MPSKSRGLRTSTGCLTCRKRRVKCDESRPRCENCIRVDRTCEYATSSAAVPARRTLRALGTHENAARRTSSVSSFETAPVTLPVDTGHSSHSDIPQTWIPFPIDDGDDLNGNATVTDGGFLFDDRLLFPMGNPMSPILGPFEWYDLLAQDAITNIQEHNASNQAQRWNFDKFSLSRRETPRQSPTPQLPPPHMQDNNTDIQSEQQATTEPWNTVARIELSSEEMTFFEHFITAVGPILDLFDPARHFSCVIPHLALRNVGLLKSLLAVGACHMALHQSSQPDADYQANIPPSTPASTHSNIMTVSSSSRKAEQYYYETLHYLAQNLLYPSYTSSHEILATAIMISTYEMLGAYGDSDNGNWGRHLKGAFWIQRNQDNDGESVDGLRQAVWWAWLRQDLWAAFREGRPALTIWQPKKMLSQLTSDELATRIIYIAAKCVQFAATPKEADIAGYIEAGEKLMQMLEQWKQILPPSFEPIPIALSVPASSTADTPQFSPIWIHPPHHAAAVQMYHFARIIVLLNQPTTGGLNKYQIRGKMLRESMSTICGITVAEQSQNLPSAFVNFQAVYVAALCAETQEKQAEVLSILEKTLYVSKFPAKSMLSDLVKLWGSGG